MLTCGYWLLLNDVPRGPFTREEIQARLTENRLSRDTEVCVVGESVWRPLSQLAEFGAAADAPFAPDPPTPKAKTSIVGAIGAGLAGLGVMFIASLKKAPVGAIAGRAAREAHRQGYSWASVLGVIFWAAVALAIIAAIMSLLVAGLKKLLALLKAPATPAVRPEPTAARKADIAETGGSRQVTDCSAAVWWIAHNGQLSGPFSTATVTDAAMAGRFRPETPIRHMSEATWLPMSAWLKSRATAGAGDCDSETAEQNRSWRDNRA